MKNFHRRDRKERRGNLNDFFGSVSLLTLRLCGSFFFKSSFSHPALLFILATNFCFFTPVSVQAQSVDSNIQAGIADYRQQNFEQAEINFRKAQKKQPENPRLNYNLANSHYKNGKYQEALESYAHTTGNDTPPDLKKNSLYNSGNTLYRMGKFEESISAYKKVLEINSGDMDAKFNLEFVREKLKEKQQDQKKNRSQDGDPGDNKKPQQNPSPENNSENEEDRKNSAQQESQEPANEPEQKESEPSELAEGQENSISKDQAEQWLSGLDEDLKKFSQKQARQEKGNATASLRDW